MKKYFICLANSKKYGERCIAGIEVSKNENSNYTIVNKDSKPKWIRPISGEEHGEVASNLVSSINLLDVVEIEGIEEIPNGYQSENIKFLPTSLKVIGHISNSHENLELLLDNHQANLFGNRGKAIHPDTIQTVNKSLRVSLKTKKS